MTEGLKIKFGAHFLEGGEAIGSHSDVQTTAGLRITKQSFLGLGKGTNFWAVTVKVAIGASGSATLINLPVDILQARHARAVQGGTDAAALAHLGEVPQQAEAGHISHRLHPGLATQ